jgi:hypothetical protein
MPYDAAQISAEHEHRQEKGKPSNFAHAKNFWKKE